MSQKPSICPASPTSSTFMKTTGFGEPEWLERKGEYIAAMYFFRLGEPTFHFVVGGAMASGCVERSR